MLTCWGNLPLAARADISQAEIDRMIAQGVSYLRANMPQTGGGRDSLAALALIKAGQPTDLPEIAAVVEGIFKKITSEGYQPRSGQEHIYESGVDLMLLGELDPGLYVGQMQSILDYILSQQGPKGDWDYPNRDVGDTSITQYAGLGLWAAERAGLIVPREAWDRAAAWHTGTQLPDGGFAYHPGRQSGPGNGQSTLNMTAGGTGTLALAKIHLYDDRPVPTGQSEPAGKKFGVLQKVNTENTPDRKNAPFKRTVSAARIEESIRRGLAWFTERFDPNGPMEHRMYFYYALERTAALNDIQKIGDQDWFEVCAERLQQQQQDNGSWEGQSGAAVSTSFAVLFLTKSTAKALGRERPDPVQGGLLAGGRGLPNDLRTARLEGGDVQSTKELTPIDVLLRSLETAKADELPQLQQALVEQVQLGNREELIGQVDRLLKLARHPDVEVRRTSLWALGRSKNLKAVPTLLNGLSDNNVDVMIEAQNALCALSRRPRGVGLPASPFAGLPEDTSPEARTTAAASWREEALRKWKAWYFQIRPYDERDDLQQIKRQ